jgi:ribulose 1,5-bisphosphate carboxylase large subunit-like protein
MDLDPVHEDRACLAAVDAEVDQGVPAGVAARLLELVGVDGHVVGAFAVTSTKTAVIECGNR